MTVFLTIFNRGLIAIGLTRRILLYYRSSAVPGTWEYLELLEQQDQEEAKISKRFKMMRTKKDICDCNSCIERLRMLNILKNRLMRP